MCALGRAPQRQHDVLGEASTDERQELRVVAEADCHRALKGQHPLPPRHGGEAMVDQERSEPTAKRRDHRSLGSWSRRRLSDRADKRPPGRRGSLLNARRRAAASHLTGLLRTPRAAAASPETPAQRMLRPMSALLTDLYQLTMSQGYWVHDRAQDEAVFHLFFRRAPFHGSFALACGMERVVELIEGFALREAEVTYLASLRGADGKAIFRDDFLAWLREQELSLDIDAVSEGDVCFPHTPLLRVRGPLWQCQVLETALLTVVNFETLIATKSARMCMAAGGRDVLEFGLRRAQGVDGGLSASRAAYVGGCIGTSNVLAGQRFGIPVRGTHAHAWVMTFPTEQEAFDAYAQALPNNCVFLVDTYDTLEGVKKAIRTAQNLRARGHEVNGIRLDSGNLTELSKGARELLDAAGFPGIKIVASDDLDERRISSLLAEGAQIDIFGVGTRLVTAYDQPALGGVYKLAAIRHPGEDTGGEAWRYAMKLSAQPIKNSIPGVLSTSRAYDASGHALVDLIIDQELGDGTQGVPVEGGESAEVPGVTRRELLSPLIRDGKRVRAACSLPDTRDYARRELATLPPQFTRLDEAEPYPVWLEARLSARRAAMAQHLRAPQSEA